MSEQITVHRMARTKKFSFWIPVTAFVAWYGVMFYAMRRAIEPVPIFKEEIR